MPYSIVIDFYCQDKKIKEHNLYPGTVYALLLNIIRTVDPELSVKLHDELANKTITVRKLYHDLHFLMVKLTLLDDGLFDKFANIMLQACIPEFDLNGQIVKIGRITCTNESETSWARYYSYKEIFEQASHTDIKFNFELKTPMVFKQGDILNPLPMPLLFFKSLHKRWNSHSEIKLNDEFLSLVEKYVFISRYKLQTDHYPVEKQLEINGSVGKLEFSVKKKVPEEFIQYLNILSDYAFFSGVGYKTGVGMGQINRLVDKARNKNIVLSGPASAHLD
jgi:CRISPR-associated endoribonuclease Cas6